MGDKELDELKAKIETDLESQYEGLRRERVDLELTPEDVEILRDTVFELMNKLGLSPVMFGKIINTIAFIIGLEELHEKIKKAE